ncbi:MAG TPA: hypothetical protein PL188_04100 [Candidatus Cloacimonadota bacterium]|nr:hypothetical protein [Candidatus Cloacimonadota bacterium]
MKAKAPTKFNNLCLRCTRKCKQPESVLIITCPKFDPMPVQLEIKFTGIKRPRKRPGSA